LSKLQTIWFEEDRAKYKGEELKEQMEKTEKAVRSNTIVIRRLRTIIEKDIEATYLVDENFDDPAWQRKTIAAAAERKALRRYLKLLP
jgi:hypothetical protein